ncbi:disease resistance protein RUN1-like isoform X2 [Pyrus x bretschneideri]|uniref:disease resistance protein RUN1-like isoform X2 n=1 Tax=Pyrus x bretschneideri TaxID=225117 RepID=UPI00202EF927|nr:disease resistance protein RUN1-like isoform X2 [Pyrus x bretschneideri]
MHLAKTVCPSMAFVTTSQGNSSDSNTFRGYRYDVFLSFRGEDTRKTFTDHLYTALNNAGFLTFRDDNELERGEDIKPGLQKAIQLSRTSVVVFSKDYASSRWCLDELVVILEHKRTSIDHVVLPIFYDVDPSHLRKQTGSIEKAFAEHQRTQSSKKVKGWREALAEVANLAGMVLADGYESKFIKDIVKVIRDKLSRTHLSVESKLVGIHSRVEHINLWLQDPSHDVGVLVVYGLPGIGKTTIAKCVYNSNFESFEGSSYVESIRETASHPDGLVQMQKQILCDILNGKKEKIHNVSEGIIKIGRAISLRRVLLVLDDVDHMDQFDAVLRMKDQFYPGSKIIITTRRKSLLRAHEGITVHEVGPLGFDESLELLSQHAFGQDHPLEGYQKYSEEVVQHGGRLPLALKVLGSSLFGEPKRVWKSTLEKLKVIPNGEIMNKLRISYDSLHDDHDQKLFLHIACFFIGKDEDYIVRILDGCDFKTICGIQNLRDRCLVTIDRDNKLSMHDMIRDMGREIVRRESYEPENRSRLWRSQDSFEVLREKNGTQAIEGLMLDMHEQLTNNPINSNENVLETNSFARMHKLKLLCLRHVRLDGYYAKLPTRLRWLCWLEFPLDSIPIDFSLKKLVVLEMQYSNLRQLCKRANFLPSLKIIDVSHSHGLTEIIDFSLCPKLEELILVDCTSLIDVHESIGNLERLVYLNMRDCKNLRMLPKNMCMLKSLETLILSGCSNLDEFPVEMMKEMESLEVLATDGIPLRPERSSTILSSFPCSLVELSLKGCNLSDDVFPTDLSNLSNLRSLLLDENPICSLPVFIKGLRRLDHLSFQNCNRLESLVGLPKVHQTTSIEGCISLRKIKYLPHEQRSRWYQVGDNDNLVEWEHFYKIEPIDRVDVEIIKLLGLCNFKSMPSVRMRHPYTNRGPAVRIGHPYTNRGPKEVPVQGLYQYGIFSTFFVGNEVPGRFSYKSTKSSISFKVPLLLASHRIRGLNIFATYAKNCDRFHTILTKVSNKSKGLKWIYRPDFYGIPGEGEDMIWLSHWKMENKTILQCGDQVVVSVVADELIQIKEFGVELVQEHQNNIMISTQHNTKSDPNYPRVIGGDLSMREHIPGIYFLGCSKVDVEDTMKFPRTFLNRLITDSDEEDTDKEEGQEDEPDYTIGRTRDANNNCGLGGWKVLLTTAGLFFTLALVVHKRSMSL